MIGSFADHVELLRHFLDHRLDVVQHIEQRLLNVQGKAISRHPDRASIRRLLESCFFGLRDLPRDWLRFNGQLAAKHLSEGFEPIPSDTHTHELDPVELVGRAYRHWQTHRWPGASGRTTFAGTIYSVFVLRLLEHLSLRIWDDGEDDASGRLQEVQALLDGLNEPANTTAFVRDARWLLQTAQGTLTRHLRPYFDVAERIATLPVSDRLSVHAAGAMLTGGHLRSQLRYRVWETGLAPDDPAVLAVTRNSNSMDTALLIHDLVALLEAYADARDAGATARRLDLADAILQGLSADSELCLARLDLLMPCTVIEDLFIGDDGSSVRYTPMGERHVQMLDRYADLIGRSAVSLLHDATVYDPSAQIYSPYGIAYGFVADMLSNIAQGRLAGLAATALSAEDMFASRGRLDEKLACARAWTALPRLQGEREHFDHSAEWTATMFAGLTKGLEARAAHPTRRNASERANGRLFVLRESQAVDSLPDGFLPSGIVDAREHCVTSDVARARRGFATILPKNHIVTDRQEGKFLASVEVNGSWFAVSKAIVTLITSVGHDALIADVPTAAIDVLRLTCPGLVVVAGE